MKNRTFLDRLGVKVNATFAPQDLEVDPRFELVLEWRDFSLTREVRAKDQVLTAIFSWMEKYGWQFNEGPISFLLTLGLKAVSWVYGPIQDEIPYYLDRKVISLMMALHLTAEPIYQKISAKDQNHYQKYSLPMHPRDILEHLEELGAKRPNGFFYLGPPPDTYFMQQ